MSEENESLPVSPIAITQATPEVRALYERVADESGKGPSTPTTERPEDQPVTPPSPASPNKI